MTRALREHYDAVVIGGGPAGTTFAHLLSRAGRAVLLVERARHPRFSVGESLLPATMPLWQRLGVAERFEKAGFVRKYGAYFCFADGDRPEYSHFPNASRWVADHSYEVRRADFDQILWDAALETGLDARDGTLVEEVVFEGARATGVRLRLAGGRPAQVGARLVADCSGRATLIGAQLALRDRDPNLHRVALYCHYGDAIRSTGDDAGTIAVVATGFGWMWLIPFADGGASVGAVLDRDWYRTRRVAGADRDAIWNEVLSLVPAVANRLRGAPRTRPVEAAADFQYRLRALAGDGWVAIGDAGAFLDPVFSSGVHLAMTGAERASRAAERALAAGRLPVARDFARYARESRAQLGIYARFIYAWYDPGFREVFLRPPHGRPGVEWLRREVVSVLAGSVTPTWRVWPAIGTLLWLARRQRSANRRASAVP
ncbi:MAG TPA: NAD(P)/FAD-dependent oxidoreductase [Myxococcota bacterium]|nr:NAD(P)/FAD-dependent oxidoreductase [Myxococcota bacterium]